MHSQNEHLPKASFCFPFLCLAVFPSLSLPFSAFSAESVETFHAAARGFGDVRVELRTFGEGRKQSSWTTFHAQDAAHARVSGSKRLADLLGFGDLGVVAESKLPGTMLTLAEAGVWRLGIENDRFHELFARSERELHKLANSAKAEAWAVIPESAYPRWLDCFDNAGPGIWYGGGGAPVDIDSEFPWMAERGLAYNFHYPSESLYVAPGVLDTSLSDWFAAMCALHDIPFRTNYWEIAKPSWYWNRVPLPYVKGTPGQIAHKFEFARWSLYRVPYGSEPISACDRFSHDARRRFMASLKDNPNFLGTMAVAEIGQSGVRLLNPVAEMPETKAYWQSYLVNELGFDLPKLGLAHHGRRDFYKGWHGVSVPISRDFLGFDETSIDLAGPGWQGVADREMKGGEAIPNEGWVAARSNDPMLLTYKGKQHSKTKFADYWLRRNVSLTGDQLPHLRYLHVERPPLRSKYCDAYLNGRPLKQITTDQYQDLTVCFELADALRAGENRLALRMEGIPPIGFVTMGKLPPRPYPEMTRHENRRWYDGTNFVTWLRLRGVEQTLCAARSVEPNRPLKMMAMINHMDQAIGLAERYGAYIHDTGGVSGYWCPFTGARLARGHGIPWSVEQGGPPRDAAGFQSHITFNIMHGNDAIDMVFATTHYKETPGVREWFDDNLELIKCFGKMHLPTPPIGLLFSARNLRLGFDEPLNWHVGRGALQQVGRTFAHIETPDLVNDVINQFPVVMDCGTVQMTAQEVAGVRRYVEQGGIFVAQHHTARHLPDRADAWPLAASLGLKVTPKWMSRENFHRWADAKISVGQDQDLLPSLRGKTFYGSGVAIDWLGNENSGAVSYAALDAKGAGVRPVATWTEDGAMAIVEARLGRGRIILLGTIFFTRMRDESGVWVNAQDRGALLDEFLTALGVPRDSWADGVWAEIWRSKNGVYDLYPVARVSRKGEDTIRVAPRIRRGDRISEAVEVSALGHPKVKVKWQGGAITLPEEKWEKMKARVYIAPRADIGRAGLDWFKAQAQIWRELPLLPDTAKPQPISVPDDVIPAIEGWQMSLDQQGEARREVKLGSFAAMGLEENAKARFRKTVAIPAGWQGRRVNLCFRAKWTYGVVPQGRLWINGELAKVRQPLRSAGDSSFTVDITEQAKTGTIALALEVDGTTPRLDRNGRRPRPSGVTGVFFLEAVPPAVAATALDGPWLAAKDVNVLTPVEKGEKVTYTYLETRFSLPKDWPGKRLFLGCPDAVIRHIVLNDQAITVPMNSLDISGLVRRHGENVLRWVPGTYRFPEITREQTMVIPDLNLVWVE